MDILSILGNPISDAVRCEQEFPGAGAAVDTDGGAEVGAMIKYKTMLADPPWEQKMTRGYNRRPNQKRHLDYPTMTVDEIKALPIAPFAADGCHLWLWVTNSFLPAGIEVMKQWGFKYFLPITWVKPSGIGFWFIHLTQHLLFGYKSPLQLKERFKPNVIYARPPQNKHSRKPEESYQLIEAVSFEPRLELFAREYDPLWPKRPGWSSWGNEVENDIDLGGS